ncbi:MAG: hypothetical protein WA949_14975 [Phormidesmis sp.]
MNRFVLSALTVLLATSAAAPMAQAAEEKISEDSVSNIHQVRLAEFDHRNKFGIKDPNFSMQAVRLAELDRRAKSDDKGEFNLTQIARENRDYRNKAAVK